MNDILKSVLILSSSPNGHNVVDRAFSARGFSTIGLNIDSRENEKLPEQPPVAIILISKNISDHNIKIITLIKARYAGFNIPVLALTTANTAKALDFDSVLLEPCHPEQIVLRTIGLIRLTHMEQEICLRLETLDQDFGVSHTRPKTIKNSPFNILFVGKASPEFMVIINALQRKSANVVAAFTSFTAFDYLYEQAFDAVVMNGISSWDSALSVTQTMRKNAKLYHVPALLIANTLNDEEKGKAFNAGLNDILDANGNLEDISKRILEQANFHRVHKNLKHEFSMLGGDICTDAATQLYNKAFFDAHLTRVFKFYDSQDLPVSLCLIRVSPQDDNKTDEAIAASYQQIGTMVKNLVRLQDITARLAPNLFAITFPSQSAGQLDPVIERIESILKCATLCDPQTGAVLKIKLEISITTLNSASVTISAA